MEELQAAVDRARAGEYVQIHKVRLRGTAPRHRAVLARSTALEKDSEIRNDRLVIKRAGPSLSLYDLGTAAFSNKGYEGFLFTNWGAAYAYKLSLKKYIDQSSNDR